MRINKGTLILGTLCIITLITTACSKTVVPEQEIKNVKVIELKLDSLVTNVEYPGKLKALEEVSISPKNPGRVASMNFKVGDLVNQGDVIFTLDSRDIQAQIDVQQASLDSSQVNLERTRDSSLTSQLMSAQQQVDKAQVTYDTAKYNYEKTNKSYESLEIPKETLLDFQSKYNNSQIDLNSAKENLRLLKEKSGPQSVETAKAQVRQSEAAVRNTEVQLDNTVIKAPISGKISAKNVDVGELASSAAPTISIINTKELITEVYVSDKMMEKLKKDQMVELKITALGKTVNATVDSISPSADDKTQTYVVKIKIDNKEDTLKPGMFAKVILPVEKRENVLILPSETIKIENGIPFVYVVENDMVKKIPVKTGLHNEKATEITENLTKGAKVITEGQIFLSEGAKVKIVN